MRPSKKNYQEPFPVSGVACRVTRHDARVSSSIYQSNEMLKVIAKESVNLNFMGGFFSVSYDAIHEIYRVSQENVLRL